MGPRKRSQRVSVHEQLHDLHGFVKHGFSFTEVHPDQFEAALLKHPNIASIDPERDYTNKRTFLSSDGQAGYALRNDGELNHVFSMKPGLGAEAVKHSISNGAKHLSAFDGKLPKYYQQFGFQEHHREANWTPGQPDVVYMQLGAPPKEALPSTHPSKANMTKNEIRSALAQTLRAVLSKAETKKAELVAAAKKSTCRCSSYSFPHRHKGGKCKGE